MNSSPLATTISPSQMQATAQSTIATGQFLTVLIRCKLADRPPPRGVPLRTLAQTVQLFFLYTHDVGLDTDICRDFATMCRHGYWAIKTSYQLLSRRNCGLESVPLTPAVVIHQVVQRQAIL